jgi:hypothetical protein
MTVNELRKELDFALPIPVTEAGLALARAHVARCDELLDQVRPVNAICQHWRWAIRKRRGYAFKYAAVGSA